MARRVTLTPEAKAARKWAESAPDEWLACRSRNRHMLPEPAELADRDDMSIEYSQREGVYLLVRYCTSCGGRAETLVQSGTGYLTSVTKFTPPDGYKFTGGNGYPMDRDGRGQVRLVSIERGIERQRDKAALAAKRSRASGKIPAPRFTEPAS